MITVSLCVCACVRLCLFPVAPSCVSCENKCGAHRFNVATVGNRRFRVCIENNLGAYEKATTKHERSMVVTAIVDAIRGSKANERGGFVRKDTPDGRWYEVGDKTAREKVGHALRDALKFKLRKRRTSNDSLTVEPCKDFSKEQDDDGDTAAISHSESSGVSSTLRVTRKRAGSRQQVDPVPSAVVKAKRKNSPWEGPQHLEPLGHDDESNDNGSVLTIARMAIDTSATESFNAGRGDAKKRYHESRQLVVGGMPKPITSATTPTWNPPGFTEFEDMFVFYLERFGKSTEPSSLSRQPKTETHLEPLDFKEVGD